MVPDLQRTNYERTAGCLDDLRALMFASDELARLPTEYERQKYAATLMTLALEKLDEVERAHAMEWVGLGGKYPTLTDDEMAQAKGAA